MIINDLGRTDSFSVHIHGYFSKTKVIHGIHSNNRSKWWTSQLQQSWPAVVAGEQSYHHQREERTIAGRTQLASWSYGPLPVIRRYK